MPYLPVPQSSEGQSALSVLPADRRYSGFPKPPSGTKATGGHVRGALPQLHPREAADTLPRANICPGAGAIQGGAAGPFSS